MCGYALKLAKIRKVYYILPNSKFGGLESLIKIKGINFEQIDYRKNDVINLLKDFYNLGNEKLDPNDRHRKPTLQQKEKEIKLNQLEIKPDKNDITIKVLGKRSKFI